MKVPTRLFLLLVLLLSACAGGGAGTQTGSRETIPTTSIAPTSTATVAAIPSSTPVPGANLPGTGLLAPSPTAQPLPTWVVGLPATPNPSITPSPEPSLLDQYMPRHVVAAETDHFIFYEQDNYFPVDKTWFLQQAEEIYAYVAERVGGQATRKIRVGFLPPDTRSCPVRGLASQEDPPTVLIYASTDSTRTYLLAVLSHELGHAIPSESYPGGLPDNIALTEGLASYASGKYWDAWFNTPSLDDLIRRYIASGQYEPIHQNTDLHGVYPWQKDSGGDCLARRDKIYSEWAGFISYLIKTYGWDKMHRLFHSPPPRVEGKNQVEFPPDYEGIYGKSLNQLEWEWLRYLESGKIKPTF